MFDAGRRSLLKAAAIGLGLGSKPVAAMLRQLDEGQATQPTSRPARIPWWLQKWSLRSRVVEARRKDVFSGPRIDEEALGQLLSEALRVLSGADSAKAALKGILGDAQRVLLKFNMVGAEELGTSPSLARVLVGMLLDAGFEPGQVTLVEAPKKVMVELGTAPAVGGWGEVITVGGRPEPLTAYWSEADAVINIGFLKTHRLAGMSGCMKNVSHGVIRHPGLYHADGCSPYVGQVISSQEVSSKLRLNIVNALKVLVAGGPQVDKEEALAAYGGLLLGYDPVAVDAVGWSILSAYSRELGYAEKASMPKYLRSAAKDGVGQAAPERIERLVVGDTS